MSRYVHIKKTKVSLHVILSDKSLVGQKSKAEDDSQAQAMDSVRFLSLLTKIFSDI